MLRNKNIDSWQGVVTLDDCVRRATNNYINDIVMQESVVDETVLSYLAKYRLETKEPESLDGSRLLEIVLKRNSWGDLQMSKTMTFSEVTFKPLGFTKRGLFS